jgi:hypothetical protein
MHQPQAGGAFAGELRGDPAMADYAAFAFGRQLAGARIMAGMTQRQLAYCAGLNVNSVKRLEAMPAISGSCYSVARIARALRACGIECESRPAPTISWVGKPPTR